MLNYQVILENPALGDRYNLLLKSYNFREQLNHESVGSFDFSFEEMRKLAKAYGTTVTDIFTASTRNLFIYRNGVKILDSIIDDIEVTPEENGERKVTIKTVGVFGLLRKRYAGIPLRQFVATDRGEIAWTLIDESQTSDAPYSDLGITEGTIETSKNSDRKYSFDEVGESIVRLSNENLNDSFDFEIDNTRAFNVYYPQKGEEKPNLIFSGENLLSWTWKERISRGLTNKVHVTGDGQNENVLYATRNASNALKTPFGLMEAKSEESGVTETITLQDKGDRILDNEATSSIIFPTLVHSDRIVGWDEYGLGDSVKVNLPQLDLENEYKRVYAREFSVSSDDGVAVITTELR